MNDRFTLLLNRYLEKNATEEEREELRLLIRSNRYDHLIKEDIAAFLSGEMQEEQTVPDHTIDADALYENIMGRVRGPFISTYKAPRKNWMWAAAAAVVMALGITLWAFLKPVAGRETAGQQVKNQEDVFTFSSKDFIHLPDGSTVLLNEGSVLTYYKSYGEELREVTLTGEAYFDIRKNPDQAFIVHTGKVSTKVLGTAFNVNARNDKVIVTVTRGLVEVGDENTTYGQIKPDEQITVNTVNFEFKKAEVNSETELKWKKQSLIFDEISLEESAGMIEERFGVKVIIENEGIKKCRISAWFLNGEELSSVLELVTGTRQATYTIKDNQVIITGGIGCE